MEVVRDRADNCIIVCSIENLDPMGIHTGDSITVAPAQTLTDKEYQLLRNASIAILREIGVDTGGSNVQFSINPKDGRMVVIEMNPRVSRSSALASKATGFPIAKVAAKLAVGYTLDELRNDITGGATPASFEPSIDYVVTKIPRFAFEKFPAADPHLTTQMKRVGEVMAMGRTFQESFQKALRGLETGIDGLERAQHRPRRDHRGDRQRRPRAHPVRGRRLPHRHDAGRGLRRDRDRPLVPGADRADRRRPRQQVAARAPAQPVRRRTALPEAEGLLRPAPGQAAGHAPARGARAPPCAGRAPGLQARRHLRRRVRHADRLHVLDLRDGRRVRGRADRPPEDHGAGRRAQPHRPGHRVRLLLRARRAGDARGRLRDHHGQLQPRDGVDRLRHQRPPVLRAGDAGRRARDRRQGKARPA